MMTGASFPLEIEDEAKYISPEAFAYADRVIKGRDAPKITRVQVLLSTGQLHTFQDGFFRIKAEAEDRIRYYPFHMPAQVASKTHFSIEGKFWSYVQDTEPVKKKRRKKNTPSRAKRRGKR